MDLVLVPQVTASPLRPGAGLFSVTNLDDPIRQLVVACEAEELGMVQAADRIEACLEQKGLLKHMTLNPTLVGVDPANRASEGVNTIEVGLLAGDIAEVGWSWAACAHATCIEQAPNDSSIEEFNVALASGSALAPVEPGSIRFGSLACSHTNMALRAIAAGCASNNALISDGKNFSLPRVEQRDPEFARAVRVGLSWRVYSWKVRDLYPEVPGIVQAARNLGSSLNRSESEMQTLLRLHLLSVSLKIPGSEVPWADIKREIGRTRPPCKSKLGFMIGFVIARSGGAGGEHLKYLAVFHRNFVDASVRAGLPPDVYDKLSTFPQHFLALAMLQAVWTCPVQFVKNLQCTHITANEIAALGKAITSKTAEGNHCAKAGEMLQAAREAADRGDSRIWVNIRRHPDFHRPSSLLRHSPSVVPALSFALCRPSPSPSPVAYRLSPVDHHPSCIAHRSSSLFFVGLV